MNFETISVAGSLRFKVVEPQNEVRRLLFVLHGYGQLIHYFSRKFEGVQLENTLLVFPEGRHRFYLSGNSGRVGASWMTKEWREEDIRMNNLALNLLLNEMQNRFSTDLEIAVLGFSQGGATAARWVASGNFQCAHFISWASVYPPDLKMDDISKLATKNTFVLGLNDPFFTKDDRDSLIQNYREMGIQTHLFDGIHDIELQTLKTIL